VRLNLGDVSPNKHGSLGQRIFTQNSFSIGSGILAQLMNVNSGQIHMHPNHRALAAPYSLHSNAAE